MTQVTLPRVNQVGTNEWSDVESNDVALRDVINGNLDNSNIAAAAAIAYSKLQLAGAITASDLSDAELAALAAVTADADKLPYFTSASAAATTTLSSFMRTVLDDPDAATARATLGAIAASATPGTFNARLTLVSGTAISTTDQTAKSSVYLTPYGGDTIALYTASAWTNYTLTEKTLALGTLTSDKNYDVFAYDSAGVVTLEALAWTDNTTRATALALQNGVYVKTGATDRRYVGTFRTTTTTTTEDSAAKRFLFNAYNRKRRAVKRVFPEGIWTYASQSWRQSNASTANQVEVVLGLSEDAVDLTFGQVIQAPLNRSGGISIGMDSTTAPHADASVTYTSYDSAISAQQMSGLLVIPAAGYHYFACLEKNHDTATDVTYRGATENYSAGSVSMRAVLQGTVFA